jgi:large subunit ribosomal protein L25
MPHALQVTTRTTLGRRAKHTHDDGQVPGVVYGFGVEPKSIKVARADFRNIYRAAGTSSLIDLTIDGGSPVKALIQEVQVNPISMQPYHIDLRQIRMDQELIMKVPLNFVGESPAVKTLAGTLVHPITEVKVKCLPADLPHGLDIDLSTLKTFDDVITVGTLAVPKGVTIVDDADITLAVVVAPLTDEQLKKMEDENKTADVTAIKTEAEEKKSAEEAKKAEEAKAAAASK